MKFEIFADLFHQFTFIMRTLIYNKKRAQRDMVIGDVDLFGVTSNNIFSFVLDATFPKNLKIIC